MAFEESLNIPPGSLSGGKELLVNNLQPILFSQVFSGTPQLYAGSSFTVEEVLEIGLLVTDENVIDVDFRWYPPKLYLGNWTIFDNISAFGTFVEDRGFLEDTITKIRRYSTFTIQANANVPVAEFEGGAVDNCNFFLNLIGVELPIFSGSQGVLQVNDSVFKTRQSLQKVPLIDQEFVGRIKTLGLYIYEGCAISYVDYKCRVINAISVDLPAFPGTPCNILPGATCEILYQEFLETNVQPAFFATEGEAIARAGVLGLQPNEYIIFTSTYECPIPPNIIFTYWGLSIL